MNAPDGSGETAFQVRLSPAGLTFEAHAQDTLLDAAELAGIGLESSCRNGTCRTCILRVSHGRAHHSIEWPGLSADEKREGWILPCVAHATSDLELVAPAIR